MPGEPLVQKCVIALDQFQHAAVLPHDMAEIHFRFVAHGLAQLGIQLYALAASKVAAAATASSLIAGFTTVALQDRTRIDRDRLDVASLEPLAAEVLHQTIRAAILQHPLHLRA